MLNAHARTAAAAAATFGVDIVIVMAVVVMKDGNDGGVVVVVADVGAWGVGVCGCGVAGGMRRRLMDVQPSPQKGEIVFEGLTPVRHHVPNWLSWEKFTKRAYAKADGAIKNNNECFEAGESFVLILD
jgi:hypothetical protein